MLRSVGDIGYVERAVLPLGGLAALPLRVWAALPRSDYAALPLSGWAALPLMTVDCLRVVSASVGDYGYMVL